MKDHHYDVRNADIFKELLNCFLDIDGTIIIRVKAKKKKMLQKGHDIRSALFRRTLLLCKEFLPLNHHAMILHDELDSRDQQGKLLKKFYSVNRETLFQFQNCVFVQSNENPFIQFADFVVSICHRHYFFLHKKYKDREHSEALVKLLFEEINKNKRCPSIVELTDHKDVRGTPRRIKALELVSEYGIDTSTAYVVVDKKMTLEEALRRKN